MRYAVSNPSVTQAINNAFVTQAVLIGRVIIARSRSVRESDASFELQKLSALKRVHRVLCGKNILPLASQLLQRTLHHCMGHCLRNRESS
ncbi:hypothetical protein EMCRGX_G018403 [Ephydatia muelleri]